MNPYGNESTAAGRPSIPPFRIDIGQYKEIVLDRMSQIIDSGQLILGEWTKKFEDVFALDHGRKHGIMVTSDTAALECVLQAIDVRGQIVMMPQTAHFADVNVARRCGAIVVLVDIEVDNGIMPTLQQWIEAIAYCHKLYNVGPRVCMLVYTAGQPSTTTREVVQYMGARGIYTVEDCAHVPDAKYPDGGRCGSAADFATWSLYATKIVHSGEGGIICTNNAEAAEIMRNYRNYGPKKMVDGIFVEQTDELSYNWRLTEFQAAIAYTLWEHKDEIIAQRKRVAMIYDEAFARDDRSLPYNLAPRPGEGERNYYRYTLMVPGLKRQNNYFIYEYLKGCDPQVILQEKSNHLPLSFMAAYVDNPMVHSVNNKCPNAARYCAEHLCLPIYPNLSDADARFIRAAVQGAIEYYERTAPLK